MEVGAQGRQGAGGFSRCGRGGRCRWGSVPDEATRLLMEDFYTRVLGGQPRTEALRQAQQAQQAQPRFSEPLYWGAFVCLGNPGPLHQQRALGP